MKYFQNVVDTVRDLLSPNVDEQHYKSGMRKDPDGFMDIEWCSSKVVHTWNDLRENFQKANARKAIAPTQFNPTSTRGHCIMVLEVEMPSPDQVGVKQRGRVYVCDLAGTEPAGDIVFAQYEKKSFEDGTIEYKFVDAHPDVKKTKELQEQGKKINLSLSEMAQFFMKMAEASKAKKLQPGTTIPGCNSFFLCKYLKDTMLQAKTYLFCAIRPEVEFHKYTFATLGFAKNASVVKLAPKKATMAASAGERKLMAELDAMKALVAQLQNNASKGGSTDADRMISELQSKLAEKQSDLSKQLDDGDEGYRRDERDAQQRAEYAKRGISLVAYEGDNVKPYFSNLDEDAFRSSRFMYILHKEETVFGSKGDVQLPSLAVVKDHCCVKFDGVKVLVRGGKGVTFRNGRPIGEGQEVQLEIFDRLAMGDQLMLFRWPGHEEGCGEPKSAEECVSEYQESLVNNRASGSLSEEAMRLKEEAMQGQRNEEEYQRAMASIDVSILDLLPKTKEAKSIVDLLGRVTMSFDVVIEKGSDSVPCVMISVENSSPKYSIFLAPQEFLPKLSLLKDEMMKLKGAIDGAREYELPERHDPLYLMFDNDFHLGTATIFPEYLLYNLETDEAEAMNDVKNVAVPYNNVGLLEVRWTPLAGPLEEDEGRPVPDIDSDEALLGKSWTYRLDIRRAADLPVFCEMAYVQYEFFGEVFTSEAVQQTTYSPVFDYTKIHHVPVVTSEFLAFLKGRIELQIRVAQHLEVPPDKIGTTNDVVMESIKTGVALAYERGGPSTKKPPSDAEVFLQQELDKALAEIVVLKKRIEELERHATMPERTKSRTEMKMDGAMLLDNIINSP